jgi:ketosteroid isomerase-like protein
MFLIFAVSVFAIDIPSHPYQTPAQQQDPYPPKNSMGEKMKKLAGALLLICASVGLVYGQAMTMKPKAAPAGPSVSDAVKQLEHDWTDAMKAGDADKVAAIIGDDWVGIGPDVTTQTKAQFIASIKAGDYKITSSDFGPMTVKIVGGVAIVQGSDTEKSTTKGKDSSGKYVWMDVFTKRGDNWVAVRSVVALVK